MTDAENQPEEAQDVEQAEAAPAEEGAEGSKDLGLSELEGDETIADAMDDGDDGMPRNEGNLAAVYDIPVQVSAVLGRASMPVSQLLKLGRGAVVELDRRVGEPIDIYVNNRLVARGEVMIVDERLGITLTEIIKSDHQ